jgi:hypothetical protein
VHYDFFLEGFFLTGNTQHQHVIVLFLESVCLFLTECFMEDHSLPAEGASHASVNYRCLAKTQDRT